MKHVSAIKKIIEDGQREEALVAIDNLLELGPTNLEALKLKALIYASEGRLSEEAIVWNRVLQVDREDEDGIDYILRQQNEDREHFYFTDPIPTGGRRYLAYPKQLFMASLVGLLGCLSFFTLSRILSKNPMFSSPTVLLGSFCLLVMGPWFAIVYGWARSLRAVVVYPAGIIAETRFRKIHFAWADLADIAIAYGGDPYNPKLALFLKHKSEDFAPLMLDMTNDTSALRAKSYLLKEISAYTGPIRHAPLDSIETGQRSYKKY